MHAIHGWKQLRHRMTNVRGRKMRRGLSRVDVLRYSSDIQVSTIIILYSHPLQHIFPGTSFFYCFGFSWAVYGKGNGWIFQPNWNTKEHGYCHPLQGSKCRNRTLRHGVKGLRKELSFLFLKSGCAGMGFNARLSAAHFVFDSSWNFGGRWLLSCPVALITVAGLQSAALWSTRWMMMIIQL